MSIHEWITEHFDLWTSATAYSVNGRGSNGKTETIGTQKLRELVLEMAIRGKLVRQDPNDEPVTTLLERASTTREKLRKEGKLRSTKQPSSIEDIEKPFNIPTSWVWATLPEVANYNPGKTPPTKDPQFWASAAQGTPWVSIADMTHYGTIRQTSKQVTDAAADKVFKSEPVKPGSILMSFKLTVGKISINDVPVFHNEAIVSITPFEGIKRDYLFKLLPMLALGGDTKRAIMGNTLNAKSLARILIPLPPKDEQQRIVQKVDELMALCDRLEQQTSDQLEAHETLVDTLLNTLTQSENATELADNWARLAAHFDTLFTTERSIDKLKQIVRELAVMGKLVEQDPADESVTQLLEKVDDEVTSCVKQGIIKKPKPIPMVDGRTPSFSIPESWEWVRLGDLALRSEAGWSPKCEDRPRESDEWGVLKVSAVTWEVFQPEENKALPPDLVPRPEYEVRPSDFLISRANTADLVARSVTVPAWAPSKLMMSDKIIRFVFSSHIVPEYVSLFNNCSFARSYYLAAAGGTSGSMKNVSRKQIQSLQTPLPPAPEQYRIVKKVDELEALCSRLKDRLNQASGTRCHLAEAIVEQATG